MAGSKRKPRIVTFRASADEYDTLAKCSCESGASSIAAFVRAAVFERVHRVPIGISGDLSTLGRTLRELDDTLMDASKRIHKLLGTAPEVNGRHS
jgi:hypothetical protein